MERLEAGEVVIGDGGFVFALEKRGYVKAGPWTPEAAAEHPEAGEEHLPDPTDVKQRKCMAYVQTCLPRPFSDVLFPRTFFPLSLVSRSNLAIHVL